MMWICNVLGSGHAIPEFITQGKLDDRLKSLKEFAKEKNYIYSSTKRKNITQITISNASLPGDIIKQYNYGNVPKKSSVFKDKDVFIKNRINSLRTTYL